MEAALLAVVEVGYPLRHHDGLAVAADEAFAQQAGEVKGAPQAPPPAGGDGEAKQVGDGSGADQSRPVAADHGIVEGVAREAVDRHEAGPDVGAGNGGGAQDRDLRRPRSRRGFHGNGRTGVLVEGSRGCGGHAG